MIGTMFGLVFETLIGRDFNYLSFGIVSGISVGIVTGSTTKRDNLFSKKKPNERQSCE